MRWAPRGPQPLPAELRAPFAPATHSLYEWDAHWLDCPGADRVRIGATAWLTPEVHGLFRVQFRNQLGLTAIRPYRGDRALAPALHVEVLSHKFPTPARHLAFFRA